MVWTFYTAIFLIGIINLVNCLENDHTYKIAIHQNASSSFLSSNSYENRNSILDYIVAKLEIESRRNALKLSNRTKCEKNLKSDTFKDWNCEIEYNTNEDKKEELFCFCSNEYECGEKKKLLMSVSYSRKLRKKNRVMNLNRGADYQCEIGLKAKDNKQWSCKLFRNKHALNLNEKIICQCSYKKKCIQERIVDFY